METKFMEKSSSAEFAGDKLERVRGQYKNALNDSFNEIILKFNETMELYNNFDEREFICRLKCNWIKSSKEELNSIRNKISQNVVQCSESTASENDYNFLIEKNEQSNKLLEEIDTYNDELYGIIENIKSNFDNIRSNFLKAANNMVDEMKNQANFHLEIDNNKDDKPKDLSKKINDLKQEVNNFKLQITSKNSTEVENSQEGSNQTSSFFGIGTEIPDSNDNESLSYAKPRELNVINDLSNHRGDYVYSNNISTNITGQKRKTPINTDDDNENNDVYIASDMTKRLNNQTCDDGQIVTYSKNMNGRQRNSPILTTSNIVNRNDPVDLLSDSD